jgi:hypothetical protein
MILHLLLIPFLRRHWQWLLRYILHIWLLLCTKLTNYLLWLRDLHDLNWAIGWFMRKLMATSVACAEVIYSFIAAHASETDQTGADEAKEAGYETFIAACC